MFESLGHYKILERIGAGGIGEVFRARDTRVGRTVAIKVVSREIAADAEQRERFLADARASTALSHPNIAAVYEVSEDRGRVFVVCEFVPGDSLKTVVGGRALHPRRAADFAVQIADALAEGHAAGFVHYDLHPGNVIVTPKDKVKILDYGVAAWTHGGRYRADLTDLDADAPAVAPTLAYMSPEQASGEAVDQRTDVFSLGLIVFEMITGRQPFTAITLPELVQQIKSKRITSASNVNRAVPAEFDPIVGKAITKLPDRRYQSIAALAAELRSVAAILDVRSEVSEAAEPPVHGAPAALPLRWLWVVLALAALAAIAWLRLHR